jgi:hypothetical protein
VLLSPKVQQEVEPKVRFDTLEEANEYVKFQKSKGYRVTKPIREKRPAHLPKHDLDGKVLKYRWVVKPLPDPLVVKTRPDLLTLTEAEVAQSECKQGLIRRDEVTKENVDMADGPTLRDIKKTGNYLRRR